MAATTRTTRGVKLGDLSENALVKKSYAQLKPSAVVDDADYDNAFKIQKETTKGKSQKDIDKELRKYFEIGAPIDEEEKKKKVVKKKTKKKVKIA